MADNIYGGVLQRPEVGFDAVRDGRRAPMFWYDVDLTPARSIAGGTAEILTIAGDSFYADLDPVNQGTGVVTFQDTNLTSHGAPVFVTRGQIVNVPFTKLLIENAAQPGKRMRFFYGVGLDFKPGAASTVNVSGDVSVIDGNVARSLAGAAFVWRPASPVAAARCHVQLWNPAGSGKTLILDALLVASTNANQLSVGLYNAMAASAGGSIYNVNPDSAAATVGLAKSQNDPLALITRYYGSAYVAGNSQVDFTALLKRPLVITPGWGLVIGADLAGAALVGMGTYYEIDS